MRSRQWPCQPPRPRKPPNRIRLSSNKPTACQYSSCAPRNSVGISQFHRLITTKLRTAMETTASATNAAPLTTQRPRPLTTSSSPQLPIRCRQPPISIEHSFTQPGARQPLVPDGSQPLLQIEHRVALAREQRVETHSRARRQLLEADALDLVRYEYLALLRRQLRERRPDLGEQHLAHDRGLRSAVRGRKQILEHRLEGALVLRRPRRSGLALRRPRRASLDSLATKPVDDAIARYPSEPRARLLHRLHQPVGQHELVERLLQHVLCLGGIGDRRANEGEEAPALAPHRRGNLAVLVARAQARSERSIHLSVKTLGRGGYCGGSPPKGRLPLTSSTATAAPECRSVPPPFPPRCRSGGAVRHRAARHNP